MYEKARSALAEAQRVDEVKDVRDKAMAMQLYAKQARDRDLINFATDIKLRAERRAGELLREMAENGERQLPGDAIGGNGNSELPLATPTLGDLGVSKMQSSRWQQLAELDEAEFEAKVAKTKEKAQAAIDIKPKSTRQPQPVTESWETCVQVFRELLEKWFKKLPSECWPSLIHGLRAELTKSKRLTGG
ncbi:MULTISPECIES: hypothetical protein [unclassified Bradyrhizobium]|uniref:hypothetical protein n=1 Tax=unclassified Bradyrhizobium TaxID=2631580 RepID=UPI0028F146CB|nr:MULTISPECIES: hypothetical protein [unclassified Bradyrhizobium]